MPIDRHSYSFCFFDPNLRENRRHSVPCLGGVECRLFNGSIHIPSADETIVKQINKFCARDITICNLFPKWSSDACLLQFIASHYITSFWVIEIEIIHIDQIVPAFNSRHYPVCTHQSAMQSAHIRIANIHIQTRQVRTIMFFWEIGSSDCYFFFLVVLRNGGDCDNSNEF